MIGLRPTKRTTPAGSRRPSRVWILVAVVVGLVGASWLDAQVTSERLVKALDEPSNWLHYRGDYSGQNHRPLNQITTENVKRLKVQWVFQTGDGGGGEVRNGSLGPG